MSQVAEPQRVAFRLVASFFVDVLRIGSELHGGDPVRGQIFLTLSQASVEHLIHDPVLSWRYAAAPPPDEVRRPISVNALAKALSMSTETVRRHVIEMAARGECVRTPEGVFVPQACHNDPRFRQAAGDLFQAFARLIGELKSIGFPLPPPASDARLVGSANANYLVARVSWRSFGRDVFRGDHGRQRGPYRPRP